MLSKIYKMWYNIYGDIMEILAKNKTIQIMVIFIVLDVIFGILRSIKQHKTNSTIGIDGIIRKVAMLFTISTCLVLDYIVEIDLLGFIPNELKNYISLGRVGTADMFAMLYCIFELLSIFKNMYKIGVPLPIKLKKFLEKILKEFTNEINESEEK